VDPRDIAALSVFLASNLGRSISGQILPIDIRTHAEVSCRNPFDNYGEEYDRRGR
jgi:hypothetical protein